LPRAARCDVTAPVAPRQILEPGGAVAADKREGRRPNLQFGKRFAAVNHTGNRFRRGPRQNWRSLPGRPTGASPCPAFSMPASTTSRSMTLRPRPAFRAAPSCGTSGARRMSSCSSSTPSATPCPRLWHPGPLPKTNGRRSGVPSTRPSPCSRATPVRAWPCCALCGTPRRCGGGCTKSKRAGEPRWPTACRSAPGPAPRPPRPAHARYGCAGCLMIAFDSWIEGEGHDDLGVLTDLTFGALAPTNPQERR
jgi:hypothetical protein